MKGVVVAMVAADRRLEKLEQSYGAFSRMMEALPSGEWRVLTNSRRLSRPGGWFVEEPEVSTAMVGLVPGALLAAGRFLDPALLEEEHRIVDASFPLLRVPALPVGTVVSVEKARLHMIHGLRAMGEGRVDFLVPPRRWAGKVTGRQTLPPAWELNGAVTVARPGRVADYMQAVRQGKAGAVILGEVESLNCRTPLGAACLDEIFSRGLQDKWVSGRVELSDLEEKVSVR